MDQRDEERLRALRQAHESIERQVHEVTAIVQGRFGYPGLRDRVDRLDETLGKVKETQSSLERDYLKRKEEDAKKAKYLAMGFGAVVSILTATVAAIVGVLLQTGIGG